MNKINKENNLNGTSGQIGPRAAFPVEKEGKFDGDTAQKIAKWPTLKWKKKYVSCLHAGLRNCLGS